MIMIHFEMNLSLGGLVHWINSVYVHPEHRQQGVFRLMYDYVVGVAKADKLAKCVRLYVDLENKVAQKAYKAMGMYNIEDNYDFFELDLCFPT